MNIYFARHGQTDWNTLGKVQGSTDIPLNETGMQQADQLREYFEKNNIALEKVYTSYQARAVRTAQIVSEKLHIPYETVKGLEEMNMGSFEGHTWAETNALFPEELKAWKANRRYNTTPGGESYQMVLERLFKALDYIIEQTGAANDKNVLVISHGGVIMPVIAINEDIIFDDAHLKIAVPNATPIVFGIEEIESIRAKL